jgi:hypothetical protein
MASPAAPRRGRLLDRGLLAVQALDGDLAGGAPSRRCPGGCGCAQGRWSDALVVRRARASRVDAGSRCEVGPQRLAVDLSRHVHLPFRAAFGTRAVACWRAAWVGEPVSNGALFQLFALHRPARAARSSERTAPGPPTYRLKDVV